MDIAQEEFFPGWRSRLIQSSSDCDHWDQAAWASWWKDGLAILFSNYAASKRMQAFAPVSFLGRSLKEPHDHLCEFYTKRNHSAKIKMRHGALEIMQVADPCNVKAAELILEVFGKSDIEGIFDFVKASAEGLKSGRLKDPEGALLSQLGYIILYNVTQDQARSIGDALEPPFREFGNYTTILNWCMKIHEDNRDACLEKFCALWSESRKEGLAECWRDISETLHKHFRSPRVACHYPPLSKGP